MKQSKISKKIKHILTAIYRTFHYTFYQKYILKTFAKDFSMWFFAIFFVLLSLCYIDNSSVQLSLYEKYLYILAKSMIDFFNIFDVFILCVCLSFFIRSKDHFNFCILNSFSVKSFAILKPIFLFLFLIWLLKLFVIQPINAIFYNKAHNYFNITTEQNIYDKKNYLFDNINNEFFIIIGKYETISHNKIIVKQANITRYNNSNNLSIVYYVPELLLENNKWIIHNAIMIDNINKKTISNYNHIFNTKITIKSALTSLSGRIKISKTKQTTIYDIITYFINIIDGQTTDNTNKQFIEKFIFNFIELFNLFIGCLLTFIFCISNGRNNNFIKQIIQSFVSFFILIRIFHFFVKEMQNSVFFCFCVLSFDILILFLFYIIVYEKDFNRKIINKIKKETKIFNKKIAIKTIKTIRNFIFQKK